MFDSNQAYEHYRRGINASKEGKLDEAEPLFRSSWALGPHFKTAEELGKLLEDLDKIDDAILFLAAAAGLGPATGNARIHLASCLLKADDPLSAWAQIQIALEHSPRSKKALAMRNRLMEDQRVRELLAREGSDDASPGSGLATNSKT